MPSHLATESNKVHAAEIKEAVTKMTKHKTNKYTAWLIKILNNPSAYSDKAQQVAQEAKRNLKLIWPQND